MLSRRSFSDRSSNAVPRWTVESGFEAQLRVGEYFRLAKEAPNVEDDDFIAPSAKLNFVSVGDWLPKAGEHHG